MPFETARLSEAWSGKADRRERWLPASLSLARGQVGLRVLPWTGSGNLPGCREAQAAAHIGGAVTELPTGAEVEYVPLSGHWTTATE